MSVNIVYKDRRKKQVSDGELGNQTGI